MVDRDRFITRLYHRLPENVKSVLGDHLHKANLLLLLKFYFGKDNVLLKKGWFESERRGYPVTPEGEPLPWYTYAAIDFLNERIGNEHNVFEYGGGFSTQWYASRAGSVNAVEHAQDWVDEMRNSLPNNGEIHYRSVNDGYVTAAKEHAPVNIVVIDGRRRTDCIEPAIDALGSDGVIIWDDYHRHGPDAEVFTPLYEAGFSVVPFYGLKALNSHYRSTAVFYRDNNCLGL